MLADQPVDGLASGTAPRRRVEWARADAELRDRPWRDAQVLLDRRRADGRRFLTVRADPAHGYWIDAPGFGRHLVAANGSRISSAVPKRAGAGAERLFFAQALPLAARLQGLTLLHGAAVAVDGRAAALCAPSGTGKSTVAAALVAEGATLLTDDVLALETDGDVVLVHPGPARAHVPAALLASLSPDERRHLGRRLPGGPKPRLAVPVASAPASLAVLCVLRRGAGARVGFRERRPRDPRLVLESGYLTYLRAPDQLLDELEGATRIAAGVRQVEVTLPASEAPEASARRVAARVLAAIGQFRPRTGG